MKKKIDSYGTEYNNIKTQLGDGSWNITWKWDKYPDEWAISKNLWKSNNVILNLLYLRGFGRL